ncbi:hypothetical protein SAMN03159343_1885 [Klenkia marina]|uniref:BON domain-containing protein n=1 Tax=Klenkia marina TaxID=1960309 RepID=A0A1G4Y0D6_9ACTN|nr:hypothetical protein [Klenkia marina]SCX46882.1 hypothetical protein SAMN03159343_1885 [Klenkia marina]
MTDRSTARAAKAELTARLAGVPGVSGVGLTRQDADYVLRVDLAEAAAGARVPGHVDGVAVVTRVIGTVRTLPAT